MLRLFKKQPEKLSENKEQLDQKTETKKDNKEKEVAAAISLALHLHLEDFHDYEKTMLTIQRVIRPYSPWSSKIYGLRQYPRR